MWCHCLRALCQMDFRLKWSQTKQNTSLTKHAAEIINQHSSMIYLYYSPVMHQLLVLGRVEVPRVECISLSSSTFTASTFPKYCMDHTISVFVSIFIELMEHVFIHGYHTYIHRWQNAIYHKCVSNSCWNLLILRVCPHDVIQSRMKILFLGVKSIINIVPCHPFQSS